jgi:hypothetical protein
MKKYPKTDIGDLELTDVVCISRSVLERILKEHDEMLHRLIDTDDIHVAEDGTIYWECCGDTVGGN